MRNGRERCRAVFSVLDAFMGAPATLRLTEIARRTGLPVPTALRMVPRQVGVVALFTKLRFFAHTATSRVIRLGE
ncbi:helix-turn-helix domain-containing protein [Streptomyces sp. NPDC059441]|uniref:helix-turn-helix domain-containing protein n=1 Tax=Streptomyces sp. NPDC059441 TaxID=3346829 RepID=UPI00367592E5